MPTTYYGTFGFGHTLFKNYVKIEVPDTVFDKEHAAHEKMIDEYGTLWSFIYTEEQFKDQPKEYGLTEVPFGTKNAYK